MKTNPLTRDPPPPRRGQAPRRLSRRPEEAAGPRRAIQLMVVWPLEPQPGTEDETGTREGAGPAEPPEVQREASGRAAAETQPVPETDAVEIAAPDQTGRNPAGPRRRKTEAPDPVRETGAASPRRTRYQP